MTYIISIEGNIGSGKSTLCKDLENVTFKIPHKIIYENVGEWCKHTDKNNKNIFELYYLDKEKYSYLFQSYVICSRVWHILDTIKQYPNHIIICERSHLTDFYIFASVLYKLKLMTDLEFKIYSEIFKTFTIEICGTIYNRVSSEICIERIQKRNRMGENITPEYIQILDESHEKWLQNKENMLTIDGSIDITETEKRNKQIEDIIEFVNMITTIPK